MNSNIKDVLAKAPNNLIIFDSLVKSNEVLSKGGYKKISIGISGGSDSDVVIDIIKKVYHDIDAHFVFFDTGIEFKASKEHLTYLEDKYNVKIHRVKATKPIPMSVREYGTPFISKYVSEMISRLQKHNFNFKSANHYTFEEQILRHPNAKGALKWFYNQHPNKGKTISSFNIDRNKYLREFLIDNPPEFRISNKCCYWAKKHPSTKFQKDNDIDLNIIGIRKSEGGIRANSYSGCFDRKDDSMSNYRPIFWYKDIDKVEYNKHYDIINSLCYSKYGMSRTGCAGCPFAKDFEKELAIIEEHEPTLFKAVNKVFGDVYKYTREYRSFQKKTKNKLK